MYTCPKCQKQMDDSAFFCSHCGTPVEKTAPAVEAAPVVQAAPVVEATPVVQAAPVVKAAPVVQAPPVQQYVPQPAAEISKRPPALPLAIAGLACGADGLAAGVIGAYYVMVILFADVIVSGLYGMLAAVIALPLAIVGLILSGRAIKKGNQSKLSRIGKNLSMAGVIVGGILMVLGFLMFMIGLILY